MHVPDGFFDTTACVTTGAVAVMGVATAVRALRAERPDRHRSPMMGLVAAVIFAGQMINFPVADGTSGHLLGGAAAAVLLGPAAGVVCLTGVLTVQALFFADGGVAALGINVTLMALIGTLVGWAVFRAALTMLPRSTVSIPVASAAGAFASVPAAALGFAGLFAIGGNAGVDILDVAASMVGWHALIGIGEALITAALITAVMWARPDLVHAEGLGRGAREELPA